jgi:hypothetical protein
MKAAKVSPRLPRSRGICMRKLLAAGAIAIVALWIGYSAGYQRGSRAERRTWEATAITDPDSGSNTHGTTTLDNDTARAAVGIRVLYRNPRPDVIVKVSTGLAVANVPDSRVYRQYERSSP